MCEEQRGGADVLLVLQSIVLHTGAGFYTDSPAPLKKQTSICTENRRHARSECV